MTHIEPKILLVDDREDNLLALEVILQPGGFTFVRANSGRQALKILLTEFDFALILMDVNMPNLNGFETATLIYERDKLKHIPIIFITANNYGDENMFKGYQVGAIDFILKPIKPEVLRAKVGLLIDLYNKNRLLLEQEHRLIEVNRNLQIEMGERKAADEKVQQVNRKLLENLSQLEKVNQDLDRFAFMASHDLQEPLRKIRIFSGMLNNKYKDVLQEDSKMVTRIDKSAERMQTLVSSILALSKASSDKVEFEKCDLNLLLAEMIANMDEEVVEKNVTILVEPIPSLFVSPALMRQLFQNLINNAIKYRSNEVALVIKISSRLNAGNDYYNEAHNLNDCLIFVEDNGIGFDQKYSEEIFGILQKLHDSSEYEGAGIGLTLCRKIAELHHGFISARSIEHKGSVFTVSLPLFLEVAV
ncbi:MAG TPA: response regulator [Cyclobacteriaceae bacterium]|nr:response regulator [Cyclobacteriaceae bacterium]HPW63405.1 response regulator [Cyclobacteriaceae bacterium]